MQNVNLTDLLDDIQTLTAQLTSFEDKYGLPSEVFYEWYETGNEPEDDAWVMDFAEWAGLYQSRRMLISEYRALIQEQASRNKNAINRHIRSRTHAAAV